MEQLSKKLDELKEKHPQIGEKKIDERSSINDPLHIPDHIRIYMQNCKNKTMLVPPEFISGLCSNCGGAKYLTMVELTAGPYKTPVSHKQKSGTFYDGAWWENEVTRFACPVCVDPNSMTKFDNGLSEAEQRLELDRDYTRYEGNMEIKTTGVRILQNYSASGTVSGWITVHGENGVGKTFWSKCMLAEFLRMGVRGKYILAADFLSEIAKTFKDDTAQIEDIVNRYADVKVLILDEIERIPSSDWFQTKMVQFLNGRYTKGVEAKKHLTVLITNEDPENFMVGHAQVAGYLSSRMKGGMIVEVKGVDKRVMAGLDMQDELFEGEGR